MKVLSNLDVARNQVLNLRLQQLSSAPSSPVESLIYYDTTTHEPFVYNGTDWISFLTSVGAPDWTDITGKPTTIAGFGITDAITLPIAQSDVTNLVADLALKAPLASPTFTGTVTVPTPTAGDDTTKAASTAFVRAEIAALVDSSPTALDTLNELAAALGDDPNFAATLTDAIALKAPLASPTFTGTVTLPGAPATDLEAATKAYVDTAVAGGGGGTVTTYSTTIGDGVATEYVITHSLNSRDIVISVAEATTPWAQVGVDIEKTTLDTATIRFATAPSTNAYRVTVLG